MFFLTRIELTGSMISRFVIFITDDHISCHVRFSHGKESVRLGHGVLLMPLILPSHGRSSLLVSKFSKRSESFGKQLRKEVR